MLIRQIKFYLICGVISTSFDLVLYFFLVKLNVNISIAKGASFLFATGISYFLNKKITFRQYQKSYIEFINFYLAHIIAMVVDVGCNKLFLVILSSFLTGKIKLLVAFSLATLFSVIINFLSQKYWVFKKGENLKCQKL